MYNKELKLNIKYKKKNINTYLIYIKFNVYYR